MANKKFGTLVTQSMGGYTWYKNSRLNRVTAWENQPNFDIPSEIIYLVDKESGKVFYAFSKKIPGYYHGTGDIFASSFFAAYLNNQDLERSLAIAVKFVHDSIERTYQAKTEVRNGVDFESGLGEYAKMVKGSNE